MDDYYEHSYYNENGITVTNEKEKLDPVVKGTHQNETKHNVPVSYGHKIYSSKGYETYYLDCIVEGNEIEAAPDILEKSTEDDIEDLDRPKRVYLEPVGDTNSKKGEQCSRARQKRPISRYDSDLYAIIEEDITLDSNETKNECETVTKQTLIKYDCDISSVPKNRFVHETNNINVGASPSSYETGTKMSGNHFKHCKAPKNYWPSKCSKRGLIVAGIIIAVLLTGIALTVFGLLDQLDKHDYAPDLKRGSKWQRKTFSEEGLTCSFEYQRLEDSLSLEACKRKAEYLEYKYIYYQNETHRPAGEWCHIYISCDKTRFPGIQGITYEYIDYTL